MVGAVAECGLLRASFIPPAQIKAARDVLRYRRKVVQSRTAELQRLGAVLQDAGIKLDSVASSITTKSGRLMIESLIDGERRSQVLADLALGRMRSKIRSLELALRGRFDEHHALMCRLHLEHIDLLAEMIADLDDQVEAMMVPFQTQREQLSTRDGVAALTAAEIISELGVAPAQYFRTAGHLASWAGLCPGNHESGASATRVNAATATRTCKPSWSRPPGRPCDIPATCKRSTAATSADSAATATRWPATKPSSWSPTRYS